MSQQGLCLGHSIRHTHAETDILEHVPGRAVRGSLCIYGHTYSHTHIHTHTHTHTHTHRQTAAASHIANCVLNLKKNPP